MSYKTLFIQKLAQGTIITSQPEVEAWYNNIVHLNFLEPYLEEREILLHSETTLQVDRFGHLETYKLSFTPEDYRLILQTFSLKNNLSWNRANPFCSKHIKINKKNYRATLIHGSLTPQNSPKLFLRKIHPRILKFSDFTSNENKMKLLHSLVKEQKNILIIGKASSGKTTLMQTFIHYLEQKHLIIVEDTHELVSHNPQHSFLIHKDLTLCCSYALRMRPDHILLGEIRGKEVLSFFMAMSSGHKGFISTLHAHDIESALNRIAFLLSQYGSQHLTWEEIKKWVRKEIDAIIFLDNCQVKEIFNLSD